MSRDDERPIVLTDCDLADQLDMRELVPLLKRYLAAQRALRVVAPPRANFPFDGDGRLVFTIGGYRDDDGGSVAGFRAYHTFGTGDADQVVAVWDRQTGSLIGLVVGAAIGAWRTGALGGIAAKHLSRNDATTCAVIGTGAQAPTQLLAIASVRSLRVIRAYGRTRTNCERFAAEMAKRIGIKVDVVDTAEEAVANAAIVVCATRSKTPVVAANAISAGSLVITVGPKLTTAHELPCEIAERAAIVVSDSPEQLAAYGEPSFLSRTRALSRLARLCDVAGSVPHSPIADDAIRLYVSTGLAGTEVTVAAHLLRRQQPRN